MSGERTISINGRGIGPGHPCYAVAEMSANHNGDYNRAVRIIEAAKEAGADAVKLQTYTAETLTIDCDNEYFRIKGTIWQGKRLYDLYREAYTPWEWQPKLKRVADELGLDLFSSPFDATAVDYLEKLGVPAYKVSSFELVDLPLLRTIAKTGKPIIMSTGMASLEEIDEAVQTVRLSGCNDVALLKCTSAYPAPVEEMNLRSIRHLQEHFNVPIGVSDHTLGITTSLTAVAIGASIVERHFTLSRAEPGPDSSFSLEPDEFKQMVERIRQCEKTLGTVRYDISEREMNSRVFRRSLFVVEDMEQGEPFTPRNVRSIRPGYGLHTRYLDEILQKRAAKKIARGTPLTWELME